MGQFFVQVLPPEASLRDGMYQVVLVPLARAGSAATSKFLPDREGLSALLGKIKIDPRVQKAILESVERGEEYDAQPIFVSDEILAEIDNAAQGL